MEVKYVVLKLVEKVADKLVAAVKAALNISSGPVIDSFLFRSHCRISVTLILFSFITMFFATKDFPVVDCKFAPNTDHASTLSALCWAHTYSVAMEDEEVLRERGKTLKSSNCGYIWIC